jgi:phage tail tube protein FII
MPKAMVTQLKGEPDEVKRTVTKKGEKLQYFYAAKSSGGYIQTNRLGNVIHETRIDFVNGVVTGLKDL